MKSKLKRMLCVTITLGRRSPKGERQVEKKSAQEILTMDLSSSFCCLGAFFVCSFKVKRLNFIPEDRLLVICIENPQIIPV